jgi:hypothetical protein
MAGFIICCFGCASVVQEAGKSLDPGAERYYRENPDKQHEVEQSRQEMKNDNEANRKTSEAMKDFNSRVNDKQSSE